MGLKRLNITSKARSPAEQIRELKAKVASHVTEGILAKNATASRRPKVIEVFPGPLFKPVKPEKPKERRNQ